MDAALIFLLFLSKFVKGVNLGLDSSCNRGYIKLTLSLSDKKGDSKEMREFIICEFNCIREYKWRNILEEI